MRKVTVTYTFRENGCVPMIRLRGKWLQVVGFEEGTRVQVEVNECKVVLTVAKSIEPAC